MTTNERKAQQPILIVGAGGSGLSAALEMTRQGQPVRIIDKSAGPNVDSRGTGLHVRTLELLGLYGAAQPILARGNPIEALSFFLDGQAVGSVDLTANSSRYRYSPALPQAITEGILRSRLEAAGVVVEWGQELSMLHQDDTGVTVQLRGADGVTTEVRTSWLVACDGSRSSVRKLLGLSFEGRSYPEGWALMDAKVDWSLAPNAVRIWRSTSGGQFIAVPLGQGVWRLQTDTRDPDRDSAPPTVEEMHAVLTAATGLSARVSDPTWRSNFRVGRRQVSDYRSGRVLLAGDAAHVHTPAGGQGLNMGIQDGINLGWKLALVARGQADAALIDSYQAERKPIAAGVLELTEVLARRPETLVADRTASPRVQADAVGQLSHHYRSGPLAQTHGDVDAAQRLSGSRIEDLALGEQRLYELLGRHGLVLALIGDDAAWRREAEGLRRRWNGVVTVWDLSDPAAASALSLPPSTLPAMQEYLRYRQGAAVLRPDAYFGLISASAPAEAAGQLDRYLEGALHLRPAATAFDAAYQEQETRHDHT